jgi:hypothetical protein
MRRERPETREEDGGILEYFEDDDRRLGARSSINRHLFSAFPSAGWSSGPRLLTQLGSGAPETIR